MHEAQCILCGTNEHAVELYPKNFDTEDLNPAVFSARRLPDRLHETILRCAQCGLVYPRHLIDVSKLSHLYKESVYTYQEEEPYIRRTYKRYVRRLFSVLSSQPHPLSYLDIGAGNGFMLGAAKEVGFEDVWGVEPSSHAIASADTAYRDHMIEGLFSLDLIGDRRFDAISCFQTLDHISDPVHFVQQCFGALKPGGAVLFINHNISSFLARLLGERCPMIDIEHTYLHTLQTMRTLFARAGFSDISVFPVRNDYPLYYWTHLLPGFKKGKHGLIRLLKQSGIGYVVLPLRVGNLGLIAKKAEL